MNNKLINIGLFQIVGSIVDLFDWFGEKEKFFFSFLLISIEFDIFDK